MATLTSSKDHVHSGDMLGPPTSRISAVGMVTSMIRNNGIINFPYNSWRTIDDSGTPSMIRNVGSGRYFRYISCIWWEGTFVDEKSS